MMKQNWKDYCNGIFNKKYNKNISDVGDPKDYQLENT